MKIFKYIVVCALLIGSVSHFAIAKDKKMTSIQLYGQEFTLNDGVRSLDMNAVTRAMPDLANGSE